MFTFSVFYVFVLCVHSVASPGFVLRRGKAGNYVMGHSRWSSGPGAAAAQWLIVLWLMQYWSKELWVVDICTSWSRRLHNSWIVGCQSYFSWKSRGHMPQCPKAVDVIVCICANSLPEDVILAHSLIRCRPSV